MFIGGGEFLVSFKVIFFLRMGNVFFGFFIFIILDKVLFIVGFLFGGSYRFRF